MRKSGWFNESRRHSLASKGIKTAQKVPRIQAKSRWYKSSFGDNPLYNFDTWRLEMGYPFMGGIRTNIVGKTPKTAPFGQQNIRKKPYTAWFGEQMSGGGFEKHIVREFNIFDDAKAWVEKKYQNKLKVKQK